MAVAASAATMMLSPSAHAGVFIIDGTDAADHGFTSGGANFDGWLYIQKALENIAGSPDLTLMYKSIAVLGASGSSSSSPVQSAFNLSSLPGAGWSINFLNDSQIGDFFAGTGTVNTSNTSLIYLPSDDNNSGGGMNNAEEAILTANAALIDSFLGAGGGLLSHTQTYAWLQALIPGIVVNDVGTGGISGLTLTPAGMANFPGLTNSDVNDATPWHDHFTNFGAIPVLAVGLNNQAVIIGGTGGTITVPPPSGAVPEPSTWAMMILGFGIVGGAMRRSRKASLAIA